MDGCRDFACQTQETSITLIFRGPRHLPSLSPAELPRGRPRFHRCCGLWRAGTNFPRHLRPRRRPGAGGTVASAHIIGLAWRHVLHARMGLEPQKSLQAEYWISGIRGPLPTPGCPRLGQPTAYVTRTDLLPSAITAGLEDALVATPTVEDLIRALRAVTAAFRRALADTDAELAQRLEDPSVELAATAGGQRRLDLRQTEQLRGLRRSCQRRAPGRRSTSTHAPRVTAI